MIGFTVYGLAQPAGSKTVARTASGKTFVRDDSGHSGERWRAMVTQRAGERMGGRPPLEGPLLLVARFYLQRPKGHYGTKGNVLPSARPYPTTKPDTTKLVRAIEDAMKGIVYGDDTQVVMQLAIKEYGTPVRCEILVEPMPRDATDAMLDAAIALRGVVDHADKVQQDDDRDDDGDSDRPISSSHEEAPLQ